MILVDTGPLVAICDPRDARHDASVRDLDRLLPSGLAVCEAVLVEAAFHLPALSQRRRLQRLVEEVNATPVPAAPDAEYWHDVFEWLVTYADHEPDWADGCLAVLSGRDARLRLWTYDAEFRRIWRRPDGSAIPLAKR
jgi:predicted nucleic acid-binding protein